MRVQIIAQNGSHNRLVVQMGIVQRFELLIRLLVDDHVLFQPPDLAGWRLDLEKPPAMVDYFQLFPIVHRRHFIRHSRNPVAQKCLLRHHVDVFTRRGRAEMPAAGKQEDAA